MSTYLFDSNSEDREWRRLRMIEAAVDADSIALLDRTGVATGWTCLELGAGAGSLVEWLGRRVGPQGLVWAVDKRPQYIRRFSSPPYRVAEGDFLAQQFERPLDLLHGRYVLIHNQCAADMLARIHSLMKPGGYVVLEEPDFTSADRLNHHADAACQRVNEAICRMFLDAGLDPGFGLKLPGEAARAGLQVVDVKTTMHLCQGRSPVATVMAESARVLRHEYRGTGIATDADIDHYVELAEDERHWAVYYSTASVLARAR